MHQIVQFDHAVWHACYKMNSLHIQVQDVKTPTKKCGKGEKNESKWEAKNESKIALEVEGDEE